jgi:signal transduction histidine kinase/ActR/RegA family two-component response regulator
MSRDEAQPPFDLRVDEQGGLSASPVLVARVSKLILMTAIASLVSLPLFVPREMVLVSFVSVVAFMGVYALAWRLAERNRAVLGAQVFLFGTWLAQIGVIISTSSLTHQALVSGVNLVLAAGFMLGRRAALFSGIVCTGTLVLFETASLFDVLPEPLVDASHSMSLMALFGTLVGTVGLTYLGIQYMTGAIAAAHDLAERAEEASHSLRAARETEARRATRAERMGNMAQSLVGLTAADAISQEVTIGLMNALDAQVVVAVDRSGRVLSAAGLGAVDTPLLLRMDNADPMVAPGAVSMMSKEALDGFTRQIDVGREGVVGVMACGLDASVKLVVLVNSPGFVPAELTWSVKVAASLMDAAIVRTESERRVVQVQKMDALGRLSAGIAHDFNNLLTTILGGAELLEHAAEPSDPIQARLRNIRAAGEQAAALTTKLMTFTKTLPQQREVFNLTDAMTDLMPVLRRTLEESISIESHIADEVIWLDADRLDVERIILNLVANARDALGVSGHVDIGLERRTSPQGAPVAVAWVQDNGEGMDIGTQSRVFEPFFTTRQGKGATGLGLSVVYGVAQALGGDVFIDSTKDQGTCVEVHIPEVASVPVHRATKPAIHAPPKGTLVLVVEDDPDVRETVCELLELGGYAVDAVGSAAEALDKLSQNHRIRLVLSDVVMPDMGGVELAERMQELEEPTPLALISGYAPGRDSEDEVKRDLPRLTKPFSMQELLHFVGRNVAQDLSSPE